MNILDNIKDYWRIRTIEIWQDRLVQLELITVITGVVVFCLGILVTSLVTIEEDYSGIVRFFAMLSLLLDLIFLLLFLITITVHRCLQILKLKKIEALIGKNTYQRDKK